jgi:hypothetical protein
MVDKDANETQAGLTSKDARSLSWDILSRPFGTGEMQNLPRTHVLGYFQQLSSLRD